MTTVEILQAARAKIEPESAWTKWASARDKNGKESYSARSESAVCWCAVGAIEAVCADLSMLMYSIGRVQNAARVFEPLDIWNDRKERTHQEVLSAFDRAIEAELAAA